MTDQVFDILGPLPDGQVVIEASAGTGKTYTLAALATRYLAERDIAPSELLMVTFTRAATAELRSRIRAQLVTSGAALADGAVIAEDDGLSRLLADDDVAVRRDRLRRAVADFDAAAISTIHSFAAQVRSTLGITTAVDPDARLTTDVAKLVRHACADALAAAATDGAVESELPKLSDLVAATETFTGGPDLVLEPRPGRPGATPKQSRLRELVLASQANLQDLLRDSGAMGFDDVLTQLRGVLDHSSSAAVVAALRNRFKVVLIDEFQDTDRIQWEIFSTLFGGAAPDRTLVLVGDPKQAIYRFRGADIAVYLDAVRSSPTERRFTLGTNWRSDQAAIDAVHALLDGVTFGADEIGYSAVQASDAHRDGRMTGAGGVELSGLSVRVAVGPTIPRSGTTPIAPRTGRLVERDLVAHVRELLDTASIPDGDAADGRRRLRPSDVAVLVTSSEHARSTQTALRREGVPAVIAGSGSVLSSWAAEQVRLLLSAMERPSDLGRVRAHALSWFVPWTAREVAGATDGDLAVLQERLAAWSTDLAGRPVAEVLASIWSETGVVARVLGGFDGDRNVTDLDHLAEFLHDSSPQGLAGVTGLLTALDNPPESEGDLEVDADLVARRIESEADAVQIMTVWKAKGLQFPVVCLPMLWRYQVQVRDVVYTDPDGGRRTLDLAKGESWPDRATGKARRALARDEIAWEQFRVLYVALTRAQHYTAVWWADSSAGGKKALGRLLFARRPDGSLDGDLLAREECPVPEDAEVEGALAGLAERSRGTIRVTPIGRRPPPTTLWAAGGEVVPDRDLRADRFTRALDRSVHRWSFTSITAASDAEWFDPFDASGADRGASDEADPAEADDGRHEDVSEPGPGAGRLAGLAAGTEFGTFVHGVLERVDFADPDLDAALSAAVADQAERSGFGLGSLTRDGSDGLPLLVEGLRDAIGSPLGPLFGPVRLAGIGRSDRLDELSFDLRLGGAGRHPTVQEIGRTVEAYLPDGHALGPWAGALAAGAVDVRLAGWLTGSIDLVARVVADHGPPGFVVADYKTNRLTPRGHEPGGTDYDEPHLTEAMVEHHYPLQALLYGVALHRYLRSRARPGAPPSPVLGAAYLFVRGMTGAVTGSAATVAPGVFTWQFAPGMLGALSDLLDGRRSAP